MLCVAQDSAGEPLYRLFKAIKHQVEKGPVDAVAKKAKYTLNDTGLLGDDVEYSVLVSYPQCTSPRTVPSPGGGRGGRTFGRRVPTHTCIALATGPYRHRSSLAGR